MNKVFVFVVLQAISEPNNSKDKKQERISIRDLILLS